jgi:hypothetical protein
LRADGNELERWLQPHKFVYHGIEGNASLDQMWPETFDDSDSEGDSFRTSFEDLRTAVESISNQDSPKDWRIVTLPNQSKGRRGHIDLTTSTDSPNTKAKPAAGSEMNWSWFFYPKPPVDLL